MGMVVNVKVLRISKFHEMVLLVIYVAIISTNLRIIEYIYTLRAKNTFHINPSLRGNEMKIKFASSPRSPESDK